MSADSRGNQSIIAGMYQIIGEIGAGGGGIVYLAEHLRLNKKVVLKADKRTLTASPETLRREMKTLKNLNHTYIPQLYDFIEADGFVYTVMDYIDGESFDRPLKRGEQFTQAQIVEWACQLLEALIYLHSQPPHGILHADIKPANIMRTRQGSVRLIDFNIALALGAEGAVAVGRSFGYASPEHYQFVFASTPTAVSVSGKDNFDTQNDDTQNDDTQNDDTQNDDTQNDDTQNDDTQNDDTQNDDTQSDDTQNDDTQNDDTQNDDTQNAETVKIDIDLTHAETLSRSDGSGAGSSTSGKKMILLDVRSDIYSLGATLYHLLTGQRPAQNAADVVPISPRICAPAIIAIIEKAMRPQPEQRWQSAAAMRDAFLHLRAADPRTRRYKRGVRVTAVLLAVLFLAGGFTAFVGLKQMEQRQNAYVLSEYSGNALRDGDVAQAIQYALAAWPERPGLFTPPQTAEAQKALTDALHVYDLSDGFKAYKTLELPAVPLFVAMSPQGRTAACVYAYALAVVDTETAEILVTLPTMPSALAEAVYASEDVILYAGDDGIRAYDISRRAERWRGAAATAIAVSADGRRAAAIYKDEGRATVYNTADGTVLHTVDFDGKYPHVTVNDRFANPKDNLLTLNKDGSLLCVSFSDGSLWLYDLRDRDNDLILLDDTSDYTHFEGGFHDRYFAFSAAHSEESVFAVIDTVALEQTGGFTSDSYFGVQADESGIYVQTTHILVKIHPVSGEQTPLVTVYDEITRFARSANHTIVATAREIMFFNANAQLITGLDWNYRGGFLQIANDIALIGSSDTPVIRLMKQERHPEAEVFTYEPSFLHDEARISADGQTVMLFSYDRFDLFAINGEHIAAVSIPDAAQLYDQQYRRDENGSYLEVMYNDGKVCAYSAADGRLMYETRQDAPLLSLYEEFVTDTVRITSSLHGTPVAYDKNTGQFIRELEKDAYLTYVTQIDGYGGYDEYDGYGEYGRYDEYDGYIVTEYITVEGERYGLLLNGQCETLAYLPYLCDIVGNELFFDYPTGHIRKSRIYSVNELIELARSQ